MGIGSSRHDKRQGCWSWREISGNQRRRREDTFVVWEEIPTPSVCDHRDTMNSEASSISPLAPTQERLMQVMITVSLGIFLLDTPSNWYLLLVGDFTKDIY
uniref:G_PROTEIN_RECEP_F1_2 domain-containing protein n=1 Tax=Caenorhabditis tropicalis TaxID=1561998 RepID=A0A1I7UIY2_9PELO